MGNTYGIKKCRKQGNFIVFGQQPNQSVNQKNIKEKRNKRNYVKKKRTLMEKLNRQEIDET